MHRDYALFLLGIASTREGFNGECLFDHLAPTKALADRRALSPALVDYDTEQTRRLFAEAQKILEAGA